MPVNIYDLFFFLLSLNCFYVICISLLDDINNIVLVCVWEGLWYSIRSKTKLVLYGLTLFWYSIPSIQVIRFQFQVRVTLPAHYSRRKIHIFLLNCSASAIWSNVLIIYYDTSLLWVCISCVNKRQRFNSLNWVFTFVAALPTICSCAVRILI